jgi:hypothetical protein
MPIHHKLQAKKHHQVFKPHHVVSEKNECGHKGEYAENNLFTDTFDAEQ